MAATDCPLLLGAVFVLDRAVLNGHLLVFTIADGTATP